MCCLCVVRVLFVRWRMEFHERLLFLWSFPFKQSFETCVDIRYTVQVRKVRKIIKIQPTQWFFTKSMVLNQPNQWCFTLNEIEFNRLEVQTCRTKNLRIQIHNTDFPKVFSSDTFFHQKFQVAKMEVLNLIRLN